MTFKVAAVQMTSRDGKEANLKKARILMEEGVESGARLIALPENFSFLGREGESINAAEDIDGGESVNFLKDFAASNKVWIVGGSIPLRATEPIRTAEKKVYNTSLLISDKGEVTARYDKIHLFDVDLEGGESHRESQFVEGGNRSVCVDTPFGKIGMSVCYDLRFPELYRRLTMAGARIVFVPAAFTEETGKAHWEVLLRARAIENQVYIVAPAQFGIHNEKRITYGNSMIIDPWGEVIARAQNMETVICAEIDSSYQDGIRKSIPCLGHRLLD